ncbi:hypothetical protein M0220_07430 [Halomonas qinghailakensis]|uniref:Phasin domain-containing protein n=2 Tax=Halomonas TaxID=2745 RepID=A0AA46YS00_9GAMM|nr:MULTISPECIES: hypothetical protein [Halomonas]UYO75965.1 hypothetical protein M0220_07430 [Halomonas sp. ZZQ-149]UYV19158.1 hypothetical protein K1Y77_00235 [Halomonas qaidamensis]
MKHSSITTSAAPLAMFDIWKAGLMAFELWSSSLTTIAMRQQMWQTQPFFSPSMMRENQRMVSEKMEASAEAGLVMQKTLINAMSGQYAPWWVTSQKAMKPYHRRSSANSRRLSR